MNAIWTTWARTASRHAARVMVVETDTGRSVTGHDLLRACEERAAAWSGIPRGSKIAFRQSNGVDWFVTFLAIQKVGCIAIPIEMSMEGEALSRMAQALNVQWLIQTVDDLPRRFIPCPPPQKRELRRGICCAKLTSGTTGEIKPIWCAARHLLADGEQVARTMGIRSIDRNLAVIPLGHSYGLGNLVMPLIMRGVPVVCCGSLVPRHLLRVIQDEGVTVVPTVPAVLRALANTHGAAVPPSLRLVISAGAPLSSDVARAFHDRFGIRIHNFYGSSETGGICYDRNGSAALNGRSVGKPLRGVTIALRQDGRVQVKGAAVAMPRGVHVLPDLAQWTARGELRLIGRTGAVANIGGRKVVPTEIERCLRGLPGVTDAWVTVLRDRLQHDYLAAFVETVRSQSELEQELTRQLPAWKLPKRYLLAPLLPRTVRGKLDTGKLRVLWDQ